MDLLIFKPVLSWLWTQRHGFLDRPLLSAWLVRRTLIKETQSQLSKLKEKVKSIEHRFSTHQVQEIMKKEEKDHKKIHLLKKQVALMHGEHQEFDKEDFIFRHERSQNHWRSLTIRYYDLDRNRWYNKLWLLTISRSLIANDLTIIGDLLSRSLSDNWKFLKAWYGAT